MKNVAVAIVGAGPYGLSLAAHLRAKNIEHRIFGQPMLFWSNIAAAGGERYLKSYCFGTNLSAPRPGFSFGDYNGPRGLETFEPCSMANFAAYGRWFQENNVPWVEPVQVAHVGRRRDGFGVTLANGESFAASQVVFATGLDSFAEMPAELASLPNGLATHTSKIAAFSAFKGSNVAVVGAGQSALEAAALLHEAGAQPQLLVRDEEILWHRRVSQDRSLWRRLRSPISGLGAGPKAWALTHVPGAMHRIPEGLRTNFVKTHLPAEGAWWLRERVEDRVAIHRETRIVRAREVGGRVSLLLQVGKDKRERELRVDHVVAGTGYIIDVERLKVLDPNLRAEIQRLVYSPKLNANFETSVPGLRFVGPASAMSFGPLFRFVVGADYTARTVSAHLAWQLSSRAAA